MVREHDQRGAIVHGGHVVAHHLVGVAVHRLDGIAELGLLRRQLAGEPVGAEEVPEEVRRRVGALDVDQQDVRTVLAPQVEADAAVGLRGGERPLEVAQVVVEVKRSRQLLGTPVSKSPAFPDVSEAGSLTRSAVVPAHDFRTERHDLERLPDRFAFASPPEDRLGTLQCLRIEKMALAES